jgi:large subunit ribosomal protein L1
MNQKTVLEALKQAKEQGKKRKFTQGIDLIINLKDLDLKKPDQQVDFYAHVSHNVGKKLKICAFVGPELKEDAIKTCDKVIAVEDFDQYKDKKVAKKLAADHDYFIAQANIMAKVAGTFGKILGTRGKMPNPKAGCVIPPKTNVGALYENLQKTLRLKARTLLAIQCLIGNESMDEEQVVDNILSVHKQLIHALPNHENNVSKVMIKLSMGKIVEIK